MSGALIPEGVRNVTLTSYAGSLRLGGHPKPASRGHLKTGQLKA